MDKKIIEMLPKLDIVIVNWNAGDYLYECVSSIKNAISENFIISNIVVVDNASTDNSMQGLKSIDLPIKIIQNKSNQGFAAGCNQAATGSDAEYLLFLNPDTRLSENALSVPINFMQKSQNKKIGICGIQLIDETGEISLSCSRFPTTIDFFVKSVGLNKIIPSIFPSYILNNWDHKKNSEVDHVIGAFYLVRRSLFEKLGGFDERFFVYLEDLDFSYRASKNGWNCYYIANTNSYHKGGGTSEKIKAKRMFFSLQSKILFAQKHFNYRSFIFISLAVLMLEPITRIFGAVLTGSFRTIGEIAKAYKELYQSVFFNKILKKSV